MMNDELKCKEFQINDDFIADSVNAIQYTLNNNFFFYILSHCETAKQE